MHEPHLPDLPSETDFLDVLIGSPGLFELTEDEVAALRDLKFQLSSALMDIKSSIRKAELRCASLPDNVDAEKNADAIIADQMAVGVGARAMVNAELRRILSPGKYRQAFLALERSRENSLDVTVASGSQPSKDQKTVEIETAVMVAERLVSWAKLFAWLVAVPAALLIAVLTVVGISKFSDFTTLARKSETSLKASVEQATKNNELFAQRVADLTQKQAEVDRQLATLSADVRTVKEKLGFDQGVVTPDAQKVLQDQFGKFQAFVIGLGYVPGESGIKVQLLPKNVPGTMAYYDKGTIFVVKEAANDPQIIYREYLHHVLYSKVGLTNIGPERSALESGLADYLVASYAGSSKIYGQAFGTPKNLEDAGKIKPSRGHQDRFPLGDSWASFFFQLRQAIGHDAVDRALFATWFELPKEAADASLPIGMMTKLLERIAPAVDSPNRVAVVRLAQEHGAPVP